jgi:ribosome-binding factor A
MSLRNEKITREVQEIVAKFINEEASKQSLITVTNLTISNDSKQATVYVTVFPREKEEQAIGFLRRKLPELREHVKKVQPMKQIPFFAIEIDSGEKHRQDIDALLRDA